MILWKPKVLHYGWWDADMYMALRLKKLSTAPCVPESSQPPASSAPIARKRGPRHEQPEAQSPLYATGANLELLRFLDCYQREHGEMPTNSEIATELYGWTPKSGGVSFRLSALEHGGWITRGFYVPRGIKITAQGRAALEACLVESEAS